MRTELVQVTTADLLTLHGVSHRPRTRSLSARSEDGRGVDAALLLHGVGGNFYNSTLLRTVAQQLVAAGITVVQANTRGHDFVSIIHTSVGPRRYGAAYESVDECRYDITAWLDLLEEREMRASAIVGHSLGAIKALYAATQQPHPALRRIVAISPPCLSFERFRSGTRAKLFAKYLARAQAHIEEKKPLTLMRVKYPFPMLITAEAYLEKYGPAERYNILRFADRVPCPALFLYGRRELDSGSQAFAHLARAVDALPRSADRPPCIVVPDADHVYAGCENRVADIVVSWLTDAAP